MIARDSWSLQSFEQIPQAGNLLRTEIGSLRQRSRRRGFRHLCQRVLSTLQSLFSRHDESLQFAEESAQSCLAGLSRFAVMGESRLELKPSAERTIVRLLEVNRPLLLPAEKAA
jgi:hypothetical protein